MTRLGWFLLFALTVSPLLFADEYQSLRDARPDGRTVSADGLTLDRDAYRFTFTSGTFHYLAPVNGTTFGAVFVGDGSYELSPATTSERQQLRLMSGDRKLETLKDHFTHMVLFFTDHTADEISAHAAVKSGSPDAQAGTFYEEFLKQQKSKYRLNFHLRVLEDLLNRPARTDGVFLALVDGDRLAPAMLAFDPLGIGNLSAEFGFFGGEETAFYSLDEQDDGFWYLSTRRGEARNGHGKELMKLVDASHYDIDTTITGTSISATAKIRFSPLVDGLRVLPLHILPKLKIASARLLEGSSPTEVRVVQEDVSLGKVARLFRDEVGDADAAVCFREPLKKGTEIEITIDYKGDNVIKSAGPDSFFVGARDSWYPNLGTFTDLATYDLTFHYPSRYKIVSVGTQVSEAKESDGTVSHWRSDKPVRVAGFNYGRFVTVKRTDEQSKITVTVYTNRDWNKLAGNTAIDAVNATRVASFAFGAPPFTEISVAQQAEWNYGQSWPSLVFLPTLALTTSTERAFGLEDESPAVISSVQEFAETVGWHEMAHQWWGHEVGWQSYRDQWLSEGFAEFTAGLVLEVTTHEAKSDQFWENRKDDIFNSRSAVSNFEAGPISQGYRLASHYAPGAPQAMIYSKGAYVLQMLRMLMRDEKQNPQDAPFFAMMKDFVTTWRDKNPSTDDFKKVVERHMTPFMNAGQTGTMDYFFDQWVHGIEIPHFKSDFAITKAGGGKYHIAGSVSQEQVSPSFITVVPLYLDFGGGKVIRAAQLRLLGTSSQSVAFDLTLSTPPRRVIVNAKHDVLARN